MDKNKNSLFSFLQRYFLGVPVNYNIKILQNLMLTFLYIGHKF